MEPTGIDPGVVMAYVGSVASIAFSAGLYVGAIRGQQKQIDQHHEEEVYAIRDNARAIQKLQEGGSPGFRTTLDQHGERIRTMEGLLREVQAQLNRLERSTIVRYPRRPGEEGE